MGKRVRQLRKQEKMTQAELAASCGISTSFAGHIERGTRIPSIDTMLTIAKKLRAPISYLLTGDVNISTLLDEYEDTKMCMLSDIMRVLNTHSDEWLHDH